MEYGTETTAAAAGGIGAVGMIIYIALIVFLIVTMWKIFAKAGQPGWAAIIPIYNAFIMIKVAGKPGWMLILMFIPIANLIVMIMVMLGLSEKFGKGGGFAAGLILLPIIFMPILAFGSAQYADAAPVEAAA